MFRNLKIIKKDFMKLRFFDMAKRRRYRLEAEIISAMWKKRKNMSRVSGREMPKKRRGRPFSFGSWSDAKLKRSRRFRMRGSASYSYPIRPILNKWIMLQNGRLNLDVTWHRRTQTTARTHARAATRTSVTSPVPGLGPGHAKQRLARYRGISRARNNGNCSCAG